MRTIAGVVAMMAAGCSCRAAALAEGPGRVFGIQILNPHNMPLHFIPGVGTRYNNQSAVTWLEDNDTFPGDSLVDKQSVNWKEVMVQESLNWNGPPQNFSTLDFLGKEAVHVIMEFQCDLAELADYWEPFLAVLGMRYQVGRWCTLPSNRPSDREHCQPCSKTPPLALDRADTDFPLLFNCSDDSVIPQFGWPPYSPFSQNPIIQEWFSNVWSVQSVSKDWLILEIKDFLTLPDCPEDCQCNDFQDGSFEECWEQGLSRCDYERPSAEDHPSVQAVDRFVEQRIVV